jgi:hypothetical protein
MEEISYRRSKLLVQTIPKGTLLFRLVKFPSDDIRGVPLKDGTRCITPHSNVFFYPNPFVGKIVLAEWFKDVNKVRVYILKKDVKVLRLLTPSKQNRLARTTKRNFIRNCNTVSKGCLPRKQNVYDPCMSDSLLKKHPEIVGILSLSIGDTVRYQQRKAKTQRNSKYFHSATDSSGIEGIPELALHPLTTRPQKDVIVKEGDTLETNFELMKSFPTAEEDKLRTFMDKHTVYDPATFFYRYIE